MQTESPINSIASALGAAHLAWAAILCAGGIYGLSASQPANREIAETLGFWNQCFAATGVSSLVGLALLHGWGGQSLRREGHWPGAITWGLLAAGALLTLTSLGILMRGMQSRLLLAGAGPLVAVQLVGGVGTLILSIATRWLAGQGKLSAADEVGFADDCQSYQDEAESTFLRICLAFIPVILSTGTTVVTLCCEATSNAPT